MWRTRRVVLAVGSESTSLNKSSVSAASGTNRASDVVSWLNDYHINQLYLVSISCTFVGKLYKGLVAYYKCDFASIEVIYC